MTRSELHAQMEAAQVKLIFAPEWPSKATSIEGARGRLASVPQSRGFVYEGDFT